jgi:cytochrome c556
MAMRKPRITALLLLVTLCGFATIAYVEADEVPLGPIRDRQELMKGIGKNAKVVGAALKAGDKAPVAAAAEKIQADAAKIAALFPPGSTNPKSRAKAAIWQQWPKFESDAKQLQTNAAALAATAKAGGNVRDAAQKLFDACKSCHDQFRLPEKKA